MAYLLILLLFLAVLFAYVDVWYFLRLTWLKLRLTIKRKLTGKVPIREEDIFKPFFTHGIVLPSDLDYMLHMNNARYQREMDFGRVGLVLERGMVDVLKTAGGFMVLNAASIRYRRALHVFERFTISTQVLCWERDTLYLEQRIVRCKDSFLATILYAKMAARGITVDQLMENLIGRCVTSPCPPPEIEKWLESIRHSSEALRRERFPKEEVLNNFVLPRKPNTHKDQ